MRVLDRKTNCQRGKLARKSVPCETSPARAWSVRGAHSARVPDTHGLARRRAVEPQTPVMADVSPLRIPWKPRATARFRLPHIDKGGTMTREARRLQAICWLGFCLAPLATFPAAAQDQASGPTVIHETKHDVSPPLRDIVASLPASQPAASPSVIPLRLTSTGSEATSSGSPDAVLQDSAGPAVGTTNLLNFEGTGADGVAPPDTNGSVGGTQFVQIVNVEYAVYDKSTGGRLLGPTPINAIWNGFGGLCQTNNGGDPIVLYDKAAGRWLVSQLAYTSNFSSNFQCIAISTSSDATGSYFRYAFDFGSNLPDYPKFGVWPDAYYWSTNTFPNGGAFVGAQACAFNRASMLAGSAGTAICFQKSTSVASLLPSDLDGSTPPPSGEPNFFLVLSRTSVLA